MRTIKKNNQFNNSSKKPSMSHTNPHSHTSNERISLGLKCNKQPNTETTNVKQKIASVQKKKQTNTMLSKISFFPIIWTKIKSSHHQNNLKIFPMEICRFVWLKYETNKRVKKMRCQLITTIQHRNKSINWNIELTKNYKIVKKI